MKQVQRTDAKAATVVEYTIMGHSAGAAKSMRTMREPAKSVFVREGATGPLPDTPK